jgi:hypothetical protein
MERWGGAKAGRKEKYAAVERERVVEKRWSKRRKGFTTEDTEVRRGNGELVRGMRDEGGNERKGLLPRKARVGRLKTVRERRSGGGEM